MKGKFIKRTLRAGALTVLLAACLSAADKANAQFAAPLQAPNAVVQWTGPNATPATSPLPPIGSGATPPAEIQGDPGTAPGVPSPGADPTTGNIFPVGQSHDQGIIYIYHQQIGPNGDNRGLKMVMTLNAATLTPTEVTAMSAIPALNSVLQTNQATTNVTLSDTDLANLNNVLAPYPITTMNNGKKAITGDHPAAGYPKTTANYTWVPVLPTVKTFCRYLVILGVCMATIWMAMASYGMVLGMPYAGSRVLGTAMGLMMLLSAFTIWKIVQMNTYNGNTNAPATVVYGQDNEVQPTAVPDLPGVPTTPQFSARDGLPVQPLIGK